MAEQDFNALRERVKRTVDEAAPEMSEGWRMGVAYRILSNNPFTFGGLTVVATLAFIASYNG
ncbi:MAG: hypothetical protein AAB955_03190 [Patescibacteria group bacterium]